MFLSRSLFFGIMLAVVALGAPNIFFLLVSTFETFGSSGVSLIIIMIVWAFLLVGVSVIQTCSAKKDLVSEVAVTLIITYIFYVSTLPFFYALMEYLNGAAQEYLMVSIIITLFSLCTTAPIYIITSIIAYKIIYRKNKKEIPSK